ncbi:MAG: serpin family protein [Candidatus Brocadiia bacterium]
MQYQKPFPSFFLLFLVLTFLQTINAADKVAESKKPLRLQAAPAAQQVAAGDPFKFTVTLQNLSKTKKLLPVVKPVQLEYKIVLEESIKPEKRSRQWHTKRDRNKPPPKHPYKLAIKELDPGQISQFEVSIRPEDYKFVSGARTVAHLPSDTYRVWFKWDFAKLPDSMVKSVEGQPWSGTIRSNEVSVTVGREKSTKTRSTHPLRAIADSNNAFAFDLFRQLSPGEPEKQRNIFFSPFSISAALTMTYAGARGKTSWEMKNVLRFQIPDEKLHAASGRIADRLIAGSKEKPYQVNVANALWGQKGGGFRRQFVSLVEKNYGAGLRTVDFKSQTETARKTINDWVAEETKNQIKDLLKKDDVNPAVRLILTNAIYFLGTWESKFGENLTQKKPFHLSGGKTVQVPMMNQTESFRYGKFGDIQCLELPYKGDDLVMLVLLPKKGTLDQLTKRLSAQTLRIWRRQLQARRVTVEIPRFKLKYRICLKKNLKAMGMTDAFSPKNADFSGIAGRRDLFISKVIHEAFGDVNEKGTEAAAATAVAMERESISSPPVVFKADHPFVFAVCDKKTGTILFLGQLMSPEA